MSEHVVWTQWDDLNVPANFKKLSPINTPAETGDLSEVTFYVPTYMGGYPALELSKKMPKLQVLQFQMLAMTMLLITYALESHCVTAEESIMIQPLS